MSTARQKIDEKYDQLVHKYSDIFEHLPTLYMLAKDCEFIVECGVRGCVSSWALTKGLLENRKPVKKLLLNDLLSCEKEVAELLVVTANLPDIKVNSEWVSDLELELKEQPDMVFIDTWHVYGQLKRELAKFGPITKKYIVMHDTTVDADFGETIRANLNAIEQSQSSGIPVEEILRGLWPAVQEFLAVHPEWSLKARYINNNGLTILERI